MDSEFPAQSDAADEDPFPASKVQEQLFLAQQTVGDAPTFHIPCFWEVRGPVDIRALRNAVTAVLARHEALRTTFRIHEQGLLQVVHPEPRLEWRLATCRDAEEREQRMAHAARAPFDLERGPLVRAGVLSCADGSHVVALCCHHAVFDGWSAKLVRDELIAHYRAFTTGTEPDLPEVEYQYGDYSLWHDEWLESPAGERARRAWVELLAGELPVLELPGDVRPTHRATGRTTAADREAAATAPGGTADLPLPGPAVERLAALATEQRTTLFTVLLAAYDLLLADRTGLRDVIVGTPALNRSRTEFQRTVGCFVNMVAVRTDLDGPRTFRELVERVRTAVLRAQDLQAVPFETVVKDVRPTRHQDHSPVFQVAFTVGEDFFEPVRAGELEFRPVEVPSVTAKYQLALQVNRTPDGAVAEFEYRADRFSPGWIADFGARYARVLELAAEQPDRPLTDFLGSDTVSAAAELASPASDFTGINTENEAADTAEAASAQPEAAPADTAPRDETERVLTEVWAEVLGRPAVGIDDNFFELGGDSISSVQIVARAGARGLGFRVRDLLRNQTVRELAPLVRATEPAGAGTPATGPFDLVAAEDRPRLPADAVAAYPLTALQSGMLYRSGQQAHTAMYHDVLVSRLRVAFSAAAWRTAVARLLERHELLRTSFAPGGFTEPLQVVHARIAHPPVSFEDLRGLPEAEQRALIDQRTDWEGRDLFDWERPPLIRYHLARLAEDEVQLWTVVHHAVIDGWSERILFGELLSLYLAALADGPAALPPPPRAHYRSFVALERAAVRDPQQLAFWQAQLDGLALGSVPAAPGTGVPDMTVVPRELPAELSAGLGVLAARLQVPVRIVLLTAHLRVIALLTGSEDVVSGAVYNGRIAEPDGDRVVGLFLNTLPVRCRVAAESWSALIRQVAATDLAIQPHRRFPMPELRGRVAGAASFETFFNYTHFRNESDVPTDGVEVLDEYSHTPTDFLLGSEFYRDTSTDLIGLGLRYDADRIAAADADRYFGYHVAVLRAMLADPAASPTATPLLAPAELAELDGWNRTERDRPGPHLLHEAITRRAAERPEAPAVLFRDRVLDYAELDGRADALAHRLAALGVRPGDHVGIVQERSPELVVSLLAVLKAGGAYVPLDPADPAGRTAALLAESGCRVVLTAAGTEGFELPDVRVEFVPDDLAPGAAPPEVEVRPGDPAYVIHTSGSTGRPKAVVVSHRAIANRLDWMQEEFRLTAEDRVLQKTPYTFDVSVWEFFWPLREGAALVVAEPGGHWDPGYLEQVLARQSVTVAHFVPSMLRAFLDAADLSAATALRQVVCSGEALPAELQRDFLDRSKAALANLYGPTEAAVDVTYWHCVREDADTVPIGRPIANTRIHLLDPAGHPVPVGVTGELHIGGVGLADGYHGRPDLTAERFVEHTWPDGTAERLYRTGDLARRRPDGAIEYLGRGDAQVKVRGMRVEPGEVEAVLSAHPDCGSAAVTFDGERLIGYYTARPGAELPAGELRRHAERLLPGHMVPALWEPLAELPLTVSGKVDRKRLPAPGRAARSAAPARPLDPAEALVAAAWTDVLGTADFGADEGFFQVGGHSLAAVRLIGRLRRDFDRRLGVAELFTHDTVERLAALLTAPAPAAAGNGWEVLALRPGPAEPLWLFPPVGGSALGYLALAGALDPRLAVSGLDCAEPVGSTVEEMAAAAVARIVRDHPAGPVHLAGWSFGAVLAFEAAGLLTAAGREVTLCMVDAAFPAPGQLDALDDDRTTEALLQDTLALTGAPPDESGSEAWQARHRVFAANLRAHHAYRPRRHPGDVVYLESRDGRALGSAEAWRAVVAGGFRLHRLDTDHYGLVRQPHVRAVADVLGAAALGG
ncbi:amino acid adenylation domain-containing protein [Kitasatospora sp. NPDC059088]|uniref:amino acid adenylation domain-containing protein n=1 Tax=Kitasatospora sp. NPDC059088 TaxID=3346722 RepID=UPI0036AA1669